MQLNRHVHASRLFGMQSTKSVLSGNTQAAEGKCLRRKMWMVMRLTVLLCIACLHLSAKAVSQKITLKEKNVPLKAVLSKIERQSGYLLFYDDNLLDDVSKITIDVTDVSIEKALDESLKGASLTYRIVEKNVVIKRKEVLYPYLPFSPSAEDSTITITGFVSNEAGKPLPGATIKVRGMNRGAYSDANGRFALKNVLPKEMLVITCIGHLPEDVSAGKGGVLEIKLKEYAGNLDETVVIAYGTTTKRYATGNITSIKAADIEKQVVQNPLMALQGRVPGLVINQQSGHEHGPIRVEIRGRNSVNPMFTSDPLYIIDGVPLTILDLGATNQQREGFSAVSRGIDQSGVAPNGGQNPLYNMNPADIESIEVLKDADATAIYGSRGANGVIIITTKKGKPGKTSFDLNYSQGVSFVTRKWDMLNTEEYIAMRREAFKNDGLTPSRIVGSPGYAPDLLISDTTRYTDWQKYVWGNTGSWTQAQASISGGTSQTSFRVAGTYNRSTDITTRSGANQRGALSFNISNQSPDQRFKMTFTGNYTYTDVNIINTISSGVNQLLPNAPAPFDKDGNLNYKEWRTVGSAYPFAGLLNPFTTKTNVLQSNLQLSYNVYRGFTAKVSVGYNNTVNEQLSLSTIASKDPIAIPKPTGSAVFGNNKVNNWIIEPQLEYSGVVFGKGRLTALAGGTLQSNKTNGIRVNGDGYTNDALLGSITNAVTITSSENLGQYKYAGAFARINLRWANRYILSLNGRRDGSSRFGPGNQFGNFGSVAGAWILSEEPWLAKVLPAAVSFIKLRGSYGITGSDAVRDYQFGSQWGNLEPRLLPYNGIAPLLPQIQPNPDFHWQVNRKMEGALDMAFFKDRLSLSVAYYRNRCNNQLVSYPTPIYTGFSSVVANLPADVLNAGWEGTVNAAIINGKKFSWRADFNISTNNNKLLDYPNIEKSPYYDKYIIGKPLNIYYAYHLKGVDPATGKYEFEDYNKDGVVKRVNGIPPGTGADDRYIRLITTPKFFGGLNNQFTFKNWQFTTFMEFVRKQSFNAVSSVPGKMANISRQEYESRWLNPGHASEGPALTTINNFSYMLFTASDGYFTDASFIRIKTVALSYSLPDLMARKIRMNRVAINMNAQNLFTITKYKGIDPDVTTIGSMPPVRTITAGLSCSF